MAGREGKLQALKSAEENRRVSKEELLRPRIVTKPEFIDGLGGEVVIRSLSHAQRQEINQRANVGKPDYDDDLLTCLTIVESLVEPKLEEKDIDALREQDVTIFDDLVLKITMLNMLGRTEDLKKDSREIPNSDSPSD